MNEPVTNLVLFSGGRTSGYMLRRLLDQEDLQSDFHMQRVYKDHKPKWVVAFCNTGKERNETLDFVHEVETRWNVPIVWLEYHRVPACDIPAGVFPTERRNKNLAESAERGESTHWFKRVDYEHANRDGEPFNELLRIVTALPNVTGRSCSAQLKIRTSLRFMFSIGAMEFGTYIGIRKDEQHRALQILETSEHFSTPKFPLIEQKITEREVMDFWRTNDFDLHLESYEGNCDLCFLKAKWKRLKLIQENPGMADWWKWWEANHPCNQRPGTGNMFRNGEPYALLEQIAENDKLQNEFCFVSADKDIPCSCAEKAFGSDDE